MKKQSTKSSEVVFQPKGTIGLEDFLKNPKRAIGMFPIFEHKGGAFFTYGDPIQTITVK